MSEAEMRLVLPETLRTLVTNKFTQARASKSLVFSDTHLTILRSKAGIPFQLRYCPALSKKPTDSKPAPTTPQATGTDPTNTKKKFDPFENPSQDLLIARLPETHGYTHNLVLNKYPVIPNHFILATRENKPQTNLLDEADLYLTYACIQAWRDQSEDEGKHGHQLYGFFNTGEHSGASQPHRHLQFLPVEDMKSSPSDTNWDVLCNLMTTPVHDSLPLFYHPGLPVVHLATPLASSLTPSELYEKYILLLRAASVIVTHLTTTSNPSPSPSSLSIPSLLSTLLTTPALSSAQISTSTRVSFSHNLAFTSSTMAIFPRRAEDALIPGLSAAATVSGIGAASINGTVLAGTLMVKNPEEWDAIIAAPELLDDLLRQVGFVWRVEGASASAIAGAGPGKL